eukprot:9311015-Karenia_brevis.AAC.1
MTIIIIIISEFHLPLWICAVDYQKAFDTVHHGSLWEALLAQGVPKPYVHALASLYAHQIGKIKGRVTSRSFDICRGTKQGDPLSPSLFNSILEHAISPVQERWRKKRFGIDLDGARLCNLRFADDILVIAQTKRQLQIMLEDLLQACAGVGLEFHMGKTKILSNTLEGVATPGQMWIGGAKVEILPFTGSTMYLGRLLSMSALHDVELDHRLDRAWKSFGRFKTELCSKSFH